MLKKVLKTICLALILLSLSACAYKSGSFTEKRSLADIFSKEEELEEVFVDVRRQKDYEKGTRPGAISLPLKDLKKGKFDLTGYEDLDFYVFGNFKREAEEAGEILRQAGIVAVISEDGIKENSYNLEKFRSILGKDFEKELINGTDMQIIDTREEKDFLEGHIEGAINIEPQDFADKLDLIDKKKRIFVIGYDEDMVFARGLKDYRDNVSLVLEGMDTYDYSPYLED